MNGLQRVSLLSLVVTAVLGTACGGRPVGRVDGGRGGSTGGSGSTGTGGDGAQGGAGGAPRSDASGVAGATSSPDGAAGTTDGSADGIDAPGIEVFIHPDGGTSLPPLAPPTAPLAVGASADRRPCYPPPPGGSFNEPLLSFDGAGHLFALLQGLGSDVARLWQLDDSTHLFTDRTPCPHEAAWPPSFDRGVFGYDVTRGGFVLVGAPGPAFDASAMWTMPVQGGTWTRTAIGSLLDVLKRRGPALTRDTQRKSLVLTAGPFMELPDGTNTWRNVFDASHPADHPPNGVDRDLAVQAYDPVRGVLIEIGTRDAAVVVTEYTIATNTWADSGTGAAPLTDVGAFRAYWNSVAKRVELVGLRATSHQNLVWHWDAAAGAFILDVPAAGSPNPGALVAATTAFDEAGGRVAVWFNGATAAGHLWTWTVATKTWTRLSPGRWPISWPGVEIRGGSAAAVYDIARGRLVSIVAGDGRGEIETLEWDGTSPTFVDPRTDAGAPWPHLSGISAAYDRERGRIMMFGLRDARQAEIWEWLPAEGTWIERSVPGDQVPRDPTLAGLSSMAYDARRGRLLLWGGRFNRPGSLWEWDPDHDAWQEREVPREVLYRLRDLDGDSREKAAIVFDESRGRAVVASAGPEIAEWDGSAWTLPAPATTDHVGKVVATYDPRRKRVVIFELSNEVEPKRRLWSWDGVNLVDETPPVLATIDLVATDGVSLTYDWKRGNLVIVGPRATPDPVFSRGYGVWELSATPP